MRLNRAAVSKKPTLAVDEAMLSIMTQRIAVMLMGKSLSSADAAMLSSVRSQLPLSIRN